MAFLNTIALLAQAQPLQPNPKGQMMQTVGMFVFMGIIFYFLLIRPQQKKAKEHAQLLKTIAVGDKVVTSSGILGTVVSLKEKSISIRSSDTKLEILKSAVSEILERSNDKGSE